MQVTHQNENVTHAVIGGKQAIEFGISSSVEFFNILSSTLYKDQILAVVRETLCNAWDAHIEAGCTDKPVEVTLTGDTFTIKDYGNGIHHDDMGVIYGTYGNSTKKNDGNQTGGFGLGCKAPFAYVEHFEVQSSNGGVKTIYNLAKSSAQVMGKPGITPITTIPTQETGLQVSLRIKNNVDYERFKTLIKRVASNGDMNVTLNGELIQRLEFDTTSSNWMVTSNRLLESNSRILVRYGNVIYPVDANEEIAPQYKKIGTHLYTLGTSGKYSIIFQAPANSISVTPSRESLSMQEHTVSTLKELLQKHLDMLNTTFTDACNKYVHKVTCKAIQEQRIDTLLNNTHTLSVNNNRDHPLNTITNLEDLADQYLLHNFSTDITFLKESVKDRLEGMIKSKLLDRGITSTYLKELKRLQNTSDEGNNWLLRRVIAPLANKLMKAGLPVDKLYVYKETGALPDSYTAYGSSKLLELTPFTKVRNAKLLMSLPYLRNIVVVSSTRQSCLDDLFQHELFKKFGAYSGFMFYQTGLKTVDKTKALEFFKNSGMVVVDLVTRSPTERKPRDLTKPSKPRIPKATGVLALSSARQSYGMNLRGCLHNPQKRIESPKFIVEISLRATSKHSKFDGFNARESEKILKLFGDVGGVTRSSKETRKWLEKGVPLLREYVANTVSEYILNSKAIHNYQQFDFTNLITDLRSYERNFIINIWKSKSISQHFGIGYALTEEEDSYLSLWQNIKYAVTHDKVRQTNKFLEGIPVKKSFKDLIDKMGKSKFIKLLDRDVVFSLVNQADRDPEIAKFLIEIINR